MPATATSVLLDLDDPRAADPRLAGAKAATLARARQAGLPVLPGCVVPVEVGRAAAGRGAAALIEGGSGHARLAVMDHPLDPALHDALADLVRRVGGRVVVRSSSTLEHDPVWSGAFSSYDDVGVDDVATAVRGVWASAFTVDALERGAATGVEPADMCLAVLVQPELRLRFGGTARRYAQSDTVEVVGVAGSPAQLLTGRERGVRATAGPSGQLAGEGATVLGAEVVAAVAALTRRVADVLGHEAVEWGWVDGSPVLLQARTAAPTRTGAGPAPVEPDVASAMSLPGVERIASWAAGLTGPPAEAVAYEPFLVDFLRCRGTDLNGVPAAPGVATGWARLVDHPDERRTSPAPLRREVLLAPYPMPALASLLWSAAGLVTGPGDPSAHLFEVATALRVPAVVDADVERLAAVAPVDRLFLAVDGSTGHVWAREV